MCSRRTLPSQHLPAHLKPPTPDGHQCRGGCGGRLHGICGEVEEEGESEINCICHTCLHSQQAATAATGKRKAQKAGCIPKRTQAAGGKKADRSAPRTRLSLDQRSVLSDFHQSAQTWASIEDQKDVVEAQRLDEADGVTAALKGLSVEGWESSDSEEDEEEDDEDGNIGGGRAEPPPYAELSKHFGPLENYSAGCGLGETSYLFKRARMLMIEAHASKPSRQTDVRAYFDS